MKLLISLLANYYSENKAFAVQVVVGLTGTVMTWIEAFNVYIKFFSGLFGMILLILSCVKVLRDIFKPIKKKDDG